VDIPTTYIYRVEMVEMCAIRNHKKHLCSAFSNPKLWIPRTPVIACEILGDELGDSRDVKSTRGVRG
jgi:hypothetical protein